MAQLLNGESIQSIDGKARIFVCMGGGCVSSGAEEILKLLTQKIRRLETAVELEILGEQVNFDSDSAHPSGCDGFCDQGPLIRIDPPGLIYTRVTPEDVDQIVEMTVKQGQVIEELCYHDPEGKVYELDEELPFYCNQKKLALASCGRINPESFSDYRRLGGYQALEKVLTEMSPEDVWREIRVSGLRGRGGAGFPTGLKWKHCYEQQADQKYIIANCDEGDPGAFMDRNLMEGDPYRIIEGMIIGAYATGASQGYVYIRIEYPLAIKRVKKTIAKLREKGYLGKNILDSGFAFDLSIRRGAGAFVCGEETALIHSVEGRRGMPRPRPPYPTVSGLWGKPTVINNVETFANIPTIISRGADWFASIGPKTSPGTKVFALAGDVVNTGLVEIPMGITLKEVVEEIGGGVAGGKKLKAVQTGGPAGGCIPAEELDIKIDFDSLAVKGSIMGSGGMIVLDEDTCMVDLAKYFIQFSRDESCGKCTPCREGNTRLLEILERITRGAGKENDIYLLRRLAEVQQQTSLCGLGKSAPNPVLSTLDYFEDEYKKHIFDRECPAGACRYLVTYEIDEEACIGCGACKRVCPVDCISGASRKPHLIDQETCIKCGQCYEVCNFAAVRR